MADSRLLPVSLIPASLWEAGDGILVLPEILAATYVSLIEKKNLRDLSASRNRGAPPVGGLTQELSDVHFAQAFDGSVARAQQALLDPRCDLLHVSDMLLQGFSGNELCLIDAPCGAGAAVCALLTAVAELRAQSVLPRIPLDVALVGADLSDPARKYAAEILPCLITQLEQQAIFVESEFCLWDATNDMSNTELIKRVLAKSLNGRKRLLIVANFNGFLEQANKRKKAEPQLKEMFRYFSDPHCAAVWIEPDMNRATGSGGTFAWLAANIKETWNRFMCMVGATDGTSWHCTSSVRFREPLDPSITPNVRIAVLPVKLEPRS